MEHNPANLYKGPVGVLLQPIVSRARGRGLLARYPLLWKAHRAVWLATSSNRTRIAGHDMLLDPKDALALASGVYEPQEKAWYEATVRRGDVVVEVGANIGFFCLILARLVGPEGQVVSYEPDPLLHGILARNVEVNGYADRVALRQAAAADSTGSMTFYRAPKNTGDNRLHPHDEHDESFPVDVVTLDTDLPAFDGRIDLLKLDIQGAEPLALAGFAETLRTAPPRRILMEFWPHGIVGMGHDPRALVDMLVTAGYRISAIDSPDDDFDIDDALRSMTVDNLRWVNLVCVHRTESEDIA